MTAARRTRHAPDADSESAIYIGSAVVGHILVHNGVVTATDATGRHLGDFKSDKLAMAAIHSARRAA
jgi:hypothetical protein